MALRITSREGHLLVDVHVVPRAKRSGVLGLHDGCLKVSLDAPPVDGAANRALIALLSEQLALPARAVSIVRGVQSRRKTVRLEGVSEDALRALAIA